MWHRSLPLPASLRDLPALGRPVRRELLLLRSRMLRRVSLLSSSRSRWATRSLASARTSYCLGWPRRPRRFSRSSSPRLHRCALGLSGGGHKGRVCLVEDYASVHDSRGRSDGGRHYSWSPTSHSEPGTRSPCVLSRRSGAAHHLRRHAPAAPWCSGRPPPPTTGAVPTLFTVSWRDDPANERIRIAEVVPDPSLRRLPGPRPSPSAPHTGLPACPGQRHSWSTC